MSKEEMLGNALSHLAARMRDDLGDLTLAHRNLNLPKTRKASSEADKKFAYAERSRIRMLRMARNMEACGELLSNPTFEREPCDIVALMSELCESAASLAEMINVRLTFSCMEDKHICAVHPRYMRLCMGNLLSNALKNASRKGYVRMIFRRLKAERGLLLAVEDNGRGIEPELLPLLFDGFWTEEPSPRSIRAIGLGLPLCKRVAEGHGGSLTVESVPGKGSTFTVRIPDAPAIMGAELCQDGFFAPDGGLNPVLVALADALPWEAFTAENLR